MSLLQKSEKTRLFRFARNDKWRLCCHCEERSDVAISRTDTFERPLIIDIKEASHGANREHRENMSRSQR